MIRKHVEEKKLFVLEINIAKSLMKKKNCEIELKSNVEKEEEKRQRREMLTRVDIGSKEKRTLQEERR